MQVQIGIQKGDTPAARVFEPIAERVTLAAVEVVADRSNTRIGIGRLLNQRIGGVLAAVVDDDQLEFEIGQGAAGLLERLDNDAFLIVGRNNDRQLYWGGIHGRLRRLRPLSQSSLTSIIKPVLKPATIITWTSWR